MVITATIMGSLLLVCLVFIIVYLAVRGFGQVSGLERLVRCFPVNASQGTLLERQTVMVGEVRYRSCASVGIQAEGLFLHLHLPLKSYPPVLIPWHEIRQAQPHRLYWMPAVRLQIGDFPGDSITVYESLFAQMRPYLNSRTG